MGEVETASKIIPVSSPNTLHISFHPEGGRVGCGVANRIFYAAYNHQNEPISIQGHITNEFNTMVKGIQINHGNDGRGVISNIIPSDKEPLFLTITSPKEFQDRQFQLPSCEDVPVMTVITDEEKKEIHVTLEASKTGSGNAYQQYSIMVYRLNNLIEKKTVTLKKKQQKQSIVFQINNQYGVLRVLCTTKSVVSTEFSLSSYLQESLVFLFPPTSSFLSSSLSNVTQSVSSETPISFTLTSTKPGGNNSIY